MKNGIYIETYGGIWNDSEVHYKNGIVVYIKFKDDVEFYFNDIGKRHRLDGPAIVRPGNQPCAWYLDGKLIKVKSQKEFEKYLNTISFR